MAAQMTSLGQLLSSAPEAAEENAEGKKSLGILGEDPGCQCHAPELSCRVLQD